MYRCPECGDTYCPGCQVPTAEEQYELDLWRAFQKGDITQEQHDLMLAEGEPRDEWDGPVDNFNEEAALARIEDRYADQLMAEPRGC